MCEVGDIELLAFWKVICERRDGYVFHIGKGEKSSDDIAGSDGK